MSREIVPIGRFSRSGSTYSFRYTRGAADVPDFRPLPGLDDLDRRYDSDRIPAVFAQRVMDPERPDYVDYLHTIGLTPELATPWEQITHSGGRRAGDTLQFMEVPSVVDGRARARFLTSGIRHVPDAAHRVAGDSVCVTADEHELALTQLVPGDTLQVNAESDNPEDPSACMVMAGDVPLGWVPRALSADVRTLMRPQPLTVSVVRIGEPGTPSHVRLVLDLDVVAPDGFRFDPEVRWEALAA
ncbi:HIRAN domain-containing protein [Ruania zhangjianzhongii]|uniref:HIRAN domain-containing protein n=1 Tax=Ruania zhangjianzhongii TaxID=2603206 RepID=UPI0011C9A2B0|nr:HIRAN domain-containing protein [Ruania zhangjianzhongii]